MKNRVSKIEKVINKKPINANDQEVKKEFLELLKEFIQVILKSGRFP